MSLTSNLRSHLEELYHVALSIRVENPGKSPQIVIIPTESNQSLFDLVLQFQNEIRLSMELKPQRYSANMVRSMGNASSEQKTKFVSFCKLMHEEGAKTVFRINDENADPFCWEKWPDDWHSVTFKVTIIPIIFSGEDMPDYEKTSIKWGSLMMGSILSLLQVVPNVAHIDNSGPEEAVEGYREGNCTRVLTNKYERNPSNRLLCLEKYGYSCQICGFDFEKRYGDIGHNFIHVHHITPVSQIGSDYIINPLEDLIPVCPNCHAMLHSSNPPISPEELKKRLK